MSGVIDDNGNQWEHCNACAKYVLISKLKYEKPSADYRYGRDLCEDCSKLSHGTIVQGVPVSIDCQDIFDRSRLAP